MTIHYHGTPITPKSQLEFLAGHSFCVSYADGRDVKRCHEIGQSVMLDNGAFSFWLKKPCISPQVWPAYYRWCDEWLDYPTTWAVIPDVIDGGSVKNDELLDKWPFGWKGAPVWHLDEPVTRLLGLCQQWPRVCFGSSGTFAKVGNRAWNHRIIQAFDELTKRHKRLPWIHMLRGMDRCDKGFPFASVDSTNVAQNHKLPLNEITSMARRLDSIQCPGRWEIVETPDFLWGEL